MFGWSPLGSPASLPPSSPAPWFRTVGIDSIEKNMLDPKTGRPGLSTSISGMIAWRLLVGSAANIAGVPAKPAISAKPGKYFLRATQHSLSGVFLKGEEHSTFL